MNTTYLNWRNYAIIITAAFILLLLLQRCNSDPATATVTIPEVKGSFPAATGDKIVYDTIYVPTGKKEKSEKQENLVKTGNSDSLSTMLQIYKDELDFAVDRFTYEKDSLQKLLLFKNAIALKSFTTNFEDDYLKLELNGIVSGEVKELTPTYTIKERKVSVPVPGVKFRLLAGAGIGINKELTQPVYKLNLGWQKKSGNTHRFSYLKINGQEFGMFETDIPVFTIKR